MNETFTSNVARGSSLYQSIKSKIVQEIQSGILMPGAMLPNERDLSSRFDVAIGTLRRAVDDLVAEGILIRQQGRGTFVVLQDRDRFMFQYFRISARQGQREFPLVKLLSFNKARASIEEAIALGMQAGQPVLKIVNVLSLGGKPVILDKIAIAQHSFPSLTKEIFKNRPGTIYELYQIQFGLTVIGGVERVRAAAADALASEHLGIAQDQPLLQINRVAHTFGNQAVEYRISMVNTEEFDYVSHLHSQSTSV